MCPHTCQLLNTDLATWNTLSLLGAGQAGSPVYGKPKLVQATRRIVTRKLIPRLHLMITMKIV